MPQPTFSPHRRRVLTLRHRPAAWQASLDLLFDRDGKPLTYDVLLARDGYGTEAEAYDRFAELCAEELAVMIEARPEEGAAVAAAWAAWFARRQGLRRR